MSGSTTQQAANNSLMSPQTIIGLALLVIGAATVAGVFIKGDLQSINLVAGVVIGSTISGVSGFYFGSSKGSQDKDATGAKPPEPPPGSTPPAMFRSPPPLPPSPPPQGPKP